MGHKTVTFTNEIEQRTYVQGEFTGKYRGFLNHDKWYSNCEFYDIHIYQGEINNLKNEKEHPKVINETIYKATISETQITQRVFKNVLVNSDQLIGGYDSFRLSIKEPKLESVQIYDVVKDGNQTFGSLHCFVSGYLSKALIETNDIEVETCDQCDQFLEECTCNPIRSSDVSIVEDLYSTPNDEESFWPRIFSPWTKINKNWGWNFLDNYVFGCLGLLGLLLGILVLISFGLPGILIGVFIFLIYVLSGQLTRSFPNTTRGLRWLFFAPIGLLLLGGLFYTSWGDSLTNPNSIPQQIDEEAKTQINEEIQVSSNSKSQNEEEITSSKQNGSFGTDSISDGFQESSESQKINSNNPPKISAQFPSEDSNSSSDEENINSQTEHVNGPFILVPESQNHESNKAPQALSDSQNNFSRAQKKLKKIPEIMSGTVFHEGEVYICKGKSSTRYHFDPDCPGLSNCSTSIYQINIPSAERLGRTLCKREY